MLSQKLINIGIKEDEIKTFLFLLENGEQTAGKIAIKTGLSRPSLYGYLKNLQEKGLVVHSQKDGVKTFLVSSAEKINMVLDEQIKNINDTKDVITKAFLEIQKGLKPTSVPRFQIFESKKEVQNILRDILLYRNMEAKAYIPIKLVIEVFGEEFFKQFNIERVKRNIYMNVIWPEKHIIDMNDYPFMGTGEVFLREIRVAPEGIDFSMGYWIYENKVACISSPKDNFGFILESKEFADMVASQFKVIWEISKKIDITEKESEELFKEMNS
ncbi:MAG: Transcriptional regulator, TrmB [Parcubacteria bacterium RAAC4_OD1_1]|nr:MAG: Transcriptional regulator, TrmB [Parcubacteria bacterium RAAC4_OD1_1]